jgi:class 3 adenylate cyclase/tetratricopeptide (TPR) repeat protein
VGAERIEVMSIESFLPESVISLLNRGERFTTLKGSVLFADVAGFTPLTESLLILGKEGSEELTRIFNDHFTRMIEIAENFCGDILSFAGDAMTLFFEKDSGERAISCALKMIENIKENSRVESRGGLFFLEMKIGIAVGEVDFGIVGDEGDYLFYSCGEPLDLSADAEHRAKRGEIVASFVTQIPEGCGKSRIDESFYRVDGKEMSIKDRVKRERISPIYDISSLFPEWLNEESKSSIVGEHRDITTIFLSFDSGKVIKKELHNHLSNFYSRLLKIVKKYGGVNNKFDFGDKGSKGLILFGSPYSLENKEKMALRCALEIKENLEKEFKTRMGITSSHLFSGTVGSESRREFTVMGDGINLSARLMTYSKSKIDEDGFAIIVDENTFKESKDEIDFIERGEISVKGKSNAIFIYEPKKIKEESFESEEKRLYGFEKVQKELVDWINSERRENILITSEIGGGKSVLANWLYTQTHLRECKSLKVDLEPFSKEIFFSLFGRVLKKLFEIKNRDDLKKLKPLIADEVLPFFDLLYPYFNYQVEDNPSLKNLSAKEKRDIVFSILLSLLEKKENFILIVDNLFYSDETSNQFLSFCLDQSEKNYFDIVSFSRDEILSSSVSNIFEKRILLPKFEEETIKEFLEREFCLKNVSETVTTFFKEKSKGNPKLLLAIYDSVLKEKLILEREGIRVVDEERLFKTTFPDSLESIYLKEFDKLSRDEKEFLFASSVFGMNVSLNLLEKVTNFNEKFIEEKVESLEKKHFILRDYTGKRRYLKFNDTLLQEAIYNLAPFQFKREIHKKIFDSILELEGSDKPSVFPYLAHHAERADDKENAIKFHRLSGRMFTERYDNLSALRHLEYVVKNDSVCEEYLKDSFILFDIYLSLGKFDEFKNLLEKNCEFSYLMSPKNLSALHSRISEKNVREGNMNEAENNLKIALKVAEDSNEIAEIARALLNLVGRVYGPTGRYDEGRNCLEKLLSLPKFDGDAVFRVVALMNLGLIERHRENFKLAKKYYKRSLNYARKEKLILRETAVIINLVLLLYEMGSFYEGLKLVRRGAMLSQNLLQKELNLVLNAHLAFFLWATGNSRMASSIAEKEINRAKLYNQDYYAGLCIVILGVSFFEELNFNFAFKNIFESITLFEKNHYYAELVSSKFEILRLLYFIGDFKSFDSQVKKWGGKDNLLKEAKERFLPKSLYSILETDFVEPEEDPDGSFIYYYKNPDKNLLLKWRKQLKDKVENLRYDLKMKWCWAYLKEGLKPPFNPMSLLSKSRGGIFGLRILAILYRNFILKGEKSKAKKIRKRFLDNLYLLKANCDERVFILIANEEDLNFALLGKKLQNK